jgi:DNA-binding IclR family transcriptional regulator
MTREEAAVDVLRAELKRAAVDRNRRNDAGPGVIESAFGLLEALCTLGRARVSDLAEESGLPRTTVYRLLGQLAAVGAVERTGAHYRLGASLLVLGQHVTPMDRLRTLAQRPMIELAAATPVHVILGMTTSDGPIYLDVFNGRERLPIRLVAGEPMPARSAGARVLAGGVDFALDDGTTMTGVSCAAQAIPLPNCGLAAVGVVVPLAHLPRPLLGRLRGTAHRIGALLSAQSHVPPVGTWNV